MKVSVPITNSSNFNLAVLATSSSSLVPANELAYLAAVFFGSPAVKVTVARPYDLYEEIRACEQAQKSSIIESLLVISPGSASRLSLDAYSPLYKGIDSDGRYEALVKPADVLRFNIPAEFEGTYAINPDSSWRAFSVCQSVSESVYSTVCVSAAILYADEITRAFPVVQWYEVLVRAGVAPAALTALLGKASVGWIGTVSTSIVGDTGMAYWQCRRSGLYMFVPLVFSEDSPTNDISHIGYIISTGNRWVDMASAGEERWRN